MRLWALTLDVRLMSLVSVGGGNSDDREFDVRPLGKVREDPVQKAQESEMLLKALKKVWDDHVSSLSKLRDVLRYMVSPVISFQRRNDRRAVCGCSFTQDRVYTKTADVPEIWDAGLILFVKHIIKSPIEDHVISAILTLIQTERDGFTINRSSVKGCVDVFLQLQDTSSREPVSIYRRDIEPAVLKESEVFYKKEGERLLETCDAPEFLRRVSLRVHDI